MNYWIQNSDFSNPTGLGESELVESAGQLLGILAEYDWAKENAYEEKCLAKNNDDCCPAGIGIVSDEGHILHICPKMTKGTAVVHLHHEVSTKILGFIKSTKDQVTTFENVPQSKLESAIKNFLANEYAAILDAFKAYAS